VVNQMPAGLHESLQKMVEMIEIILLPIVHNFERKSRLDMVIWERLKDVSESLKRMERETFNQGKR